MRKLMEVYGDPDTGDVMIKTLQKSYHLFYAEDNEEIHNFKIGNELDAVEFMLNFFGSIELKKQKLINPESMHSIINVSFKLKGDKE